MTRSTSENPPLDTTTLIARKFQTGDIPEIQAIYQECFNAGDSDYWTPRAVAEFPTTQGSEVFVLESHEEESGEADSKTIPALTIRGFIFARTVLDEAELLTIGIGTRFQGLGLSGHLLDFMINAFRAQHIKTIYLEVKENNVPAIKLYKSRGFVAVGERPDYYKDGNEESIKAIIFSLHQ